MHAVCAIRIAGLRRGARHFTSSTRLNADFTHAVVGAGAVGLAVARRLQQHEGASVVLIEKHGSVGTETSSRNSEVIHAGLYYGLDTVKSRLCIEGRQMLYAFCDKHSIPYANTGKWIVAQNDSQMAALHDLHKTTQALGVPTHFLSRDDISATEPAVRAEVGALASPSTGILDSHSYMAFLQASFEELGGTLALGGAVARVEAPSKSCPKEWTLHVRNPASASASDSPNDDGPSTSAITAATLVNSAGLFAVPLSNSILPPHRRRTPYYAKGSYYSYASREPKVSRLVYPAPIPGHGGLGTHLTLDLNGRIRFGPDVEWTSDPGDLAPNSDPARLRTAIEDIQSYLPGLDATKVEVDYCGIRPKLKGEGQGSADFWIRKEEDLEGEFVNLLGIESPGLTSSLAIAEEVWRLLYR